MRHSSVIAVLWAGALGACSSSAPYGFAETDVLRASHDWIPAGKAESYQLSADEQTRRNNDVASCVGELSTWLAQINETPPRLRLTRQERTLQLIACMEERGWHLVRVVIVVTSAA